MIFYVYMCDTPKSQIQIYFLFTKASVFFSIHLPLAKIEFILILYLYDKIENMQTTHGKEKRKQKNIYVNSYRMFCMALHHTLLFILFFLLLINTFGVVVAVENVAFSCYIQTFVATNKTMLFHCSRFYNIFGRTSRVYELCCAIFFSCDDLATMC